MAMMEPISGRTELFVVDDDATMRDTLTVLFTHEGYQVSGFAEGNSFLEVPRRRTPSCVLLDVLMPGRSGIDILKEIDAQRYDAPIFIISVQGDIPLAVDAIKNGAFDFIEKPFTPDNVVARWKTPATNGAAETRPAKFPGNELLTPA